MERAVWRAYFAAARAPSGVATGGAVGAGAGAVVGLVGFAAAEGRAASASAATLMPLAVDGRCSTRWCDRSSPIERRFFFVLCFLPFEEVLLREGMIDCVCIRQDESGTKYKLKGTLCLVGGAGGC